MRLQPALVDAALRTLDEIPITVHGLELSIGLASGWNDSYAQYSTNFAHFAISPGTANTWDVCSRTTAIARPSMPGVRYHCRFTQEAVDLVAPRADWLVERHGAPFLLGLFNLYCKSVNHHFDLREALSCLRLDRVVERLAGGKHVNGFILDGHRNAVPEPVWSALEWLVPRAPNLAGVVYEVLEPALPLVGVEIVRDQLQRLLSTWEIGV
jgi:uncharacterized protein (UPF0276 family)